MPSIRKASALVLALTLPQMAFAQATLQDGSHIRKDDLRRLNALDNSAGASLRAAFAGGSPDDLASLTQALSGQAMAADDAQAALPGDWSCRMMKLGGGLPLVVYQPFRCTAAASSFEKLTGSQRTKGDLHLQDGQLVYLGTGFIAGDTPPPYAELAEDTDTGSSPQRVPEIGVVELTATDRGRILFPDPYLESRMNILVLSR